MVSAAQSGTAISLGVPFTVSGGGTLTLNGDGSYTFDPGTAYNGLDVGETATETIGYVVSDGNGGSDAAQLVITVVGANDAPVVIDPSSPGTPSNPTPATDPLNIIADVTRSDGQPLDPIDVAQYVVDPDGEALSFAVDPATPSWISIDPVSGIITGTPPSNASQGTNTGNPGEYLVTITATDPDGSVATTTVTLTIVNLDPVAVDDASSVSEDGPAVSGNVISDALTGDSDTAPDSDPLTVVSAAQSGTAISLGVPFTVSGGGTLTLNGDGSYTFDPGTAYNGLDVGETATETIGYVVSDGNGGSDAAQLVITVVGANDAPVVIDPSSPGTPSNPTPATDPLNIIADVTRSDGQPLDPIDVAQYVVDPDGEALSFAVDPATPSWISIDPVSGIITGTPPSNASQGTNTGNPGEYLVTITATDPDGSVATTTVTLTIVNLDPVAVDDASSVSEDGPAVSGNVISDALTGDSDTAPDSDPLTVVSAAQSGTAISLGVPFTVSGGGTLTLNGDGSYTFDPGTAYNGLDVGETATETIGYVVSDGNGGSDAAQLVITVVGANDAPVSSALANLVNDDADPVSIDVSSAFSDPDTNDTLTFTATGLPPGLSISPAGVITGTIDHSASVTGPYSVTVTATDDHGAATQQTFTWTVGNPAPIAVDDTATTGENTFISGDVTPGTPGQDSDPDGDTLTVVAVNGVAGNVNNSVTGSNGGTFVVSDDGSYGFVPGTAFDDLAVGETRVTSITYTISDGEGGIDIATVSITVTGVNDPPVAVNDNVTVTEDTPVGGNVMTNDSDVDGDPLTVTAAAVDIDGDGTPDAITLGTPTLIEDASGNPIGTLTLDSDGSFTFSPALNYNGPVPTVTYTIEDAHGTTSTATLTLTVDPVNDPPTAWSESHTTPYLTPISIDFLATASDVDGDPLTIVSVTVPPEQGTMVQDGNNWVFRPDRTFAGTATITFTVQDPSGLTATSFHEVNVIPPPLKAVGERHVTAYKTGLSGKVSSKDIYPKGSVFGTVKGPSHGTLTMRANGTFRYVPRPGFSGIDRFTYSITDPTGRVVTATETIKVGARTLLDKCLTTFSALKHRRR
ncbi:MAG: Ig-like domain-containing protein [Hyphomicrobiaceae bacterium]